MEGSHRWRQEDQTRKDWNWRSHDKAWNWKAWNWKRKNPSWKVRETWTPKEWIGPPPGEQCNKSRSKSESKDMTRRKDTKIWRPTGRVGLVMATLASQSAIAEATNGRGATGCPGLVLALIVCIVCLCVCVHIWNKRSIWGQQDGAGAMSSSICHNREQRDGAGATGSRSFSGTASRSFEGRRVRVFRSIRRSSTLFSVAFMWVCIVCSTYNYVRVISCLQQRARVMADPLSTSVGRCWTFEKRLPAERHLAVGRAQAPHEVGHQQVYGGAAQQMAIKRPCAADIASALRETDHRRANCGRHNPSRRSAHRRLGPHGRSRSGQAQVAHRRLVIFSWKSAHRRFEPHGRSRSGQAQVAHRRLVMECRERRAFRDNACRRWLNRLPVNRRVVAPHEPSGLGRSRGKIARDAGDRQSWIALTRWRPCWWMKLRLSATRSWTRSPPTRTRALPPASAGRFMCGETVDPSASPSRQRPSTWNRLMIRRSMARHPADSPHALTRSRALPPVDAGIHAFDELGSLVDADGTGEALGRYDASLWIIQTREKIEGAGVGPPSLESGQGACEETPLTIRKTRSDEGAGDYPPSSCMSQGAGKESPLAVHMLESREGAGMDPPSSSITQGAGKKSPLDMRTLESCEGAGANPPSSSTTQGAGKESPLTALTSRRCEGAGDDPPSLRMIQGAGSESPLDIQMTKEREGAGADPPSPSRDLHEHDKPRLSDVKAVGPVLPPKDVGEFARGVTRAHLGDQALDRRAHSGTAISRRHRWHRGVDASPPPGLDLLDADDDAEAAASRALRSHDAADTAVPGCPGRASATPPKCPSHGREAEAVTEKSPESTDQELIGSTLLGKPQWMSQGSGCPLRQSGKPTAKCHADFWRARILGAPLTLLAVTQVEESRASQSGSEEAPSHIRGHVVMRNPLHEFPLALSTLVWQHASFISACRQGGVHERARASSTITTVHHMQACITGTSLTPWHTVHPLARHLQARMHKSPHWPYTCASQISTCTDITVSASTQPLCLEWEGGLLAFIRRRIAVAGADDLA